jgi:hypothetical protein
MVPLPTLPRHRRAVGAGGVSRPGDLRSFDRTCGRWPERGRGRTKTDARATAPHRVAMSGAEAPTRHVSRPDVARPAAGAHALTEAPA